MSRASVVKYHRSPLSKRLLSKRWSNAALLIIATILTGNFPAAATEATAGNSATATVKITLRIHPGTYTEGTLGTESIWNSEHSSNGNRAVRSYCNAATESTDPITFGLNDPKNTIVSYSVTILHSPAAATTRDRSASTDTNTTQALLDAVCGFQPRAEISPPSPTLLIAPL